MIMGRCPGCYDCPSCQHTLSVRATNITTTDAEGHSTPRKAYYLACGFCRWTSRDIGLRDQFVGSYRVRHSKYCVCGQNKCVFICYVVIYVVVASFCYASALVDVNFMVPSTLISGLRPHEFIRNILLALVTDAIQTWMNEVLSSMFSKI